MGEKKEMMGGDVNADNGSEDGSESDQLCKYELGE